MYPHTHTHIHEHLPAQRQVHQNIGRSNFLSYHTGLPGAVGERKEITINLIAPTMMLPMGGA